MSSELPAYEPSRNSDEIPLQCIIIHQTIQHQSVQLPPPAYREHPRSPPAYTVVDPEIFRSRRHPEIRLDRINDDYNRRTTRLYWIASGLVLTILIVLIILVTVKS